MDIDFNASKKGLHAYQYFQRQLLANADRFLRKDETADAIASFLRRNENALEDSKGLLERFKKTGGSRYNVFRKIGFYACEDALSDGLASIFSPRESHGLGASSLISVLNHLKETLTNDNSNFERVVNIRNAIDYSSNFSVFREKPEYQTRPDLTIIGNDFVLFIENKIRKGKETYEHEEWQTVRQQNALCNIANRLGIPDENTLGIFLSPEGKLPKEKGFIPLQVNVLVSVLRKSIERETGEAGCSSIESFLDFYSFE